MPLLSCEAEPQTLGRRPKSTSSPDRSAAFYLKVRDLIIILGDTPGVFSRYYVHLLVSRVLCLMPCTCVTELRCVAALCLGDTVRREFTFNIRDAPNFNSAFKETVQPFEADVSTCDKGIKRTIVLNASVSNCRYRNAFRTGVPVSVLFPLRSYPVTCLFSHFLRLSSQNRWSLCASSPTAVRPTFCRYGMRQSRAEVSRAVMAALWKLGAIAFVITD